MTVSRRSFSGLSLAALSGGALASAAEATEDKQDGILVPEHFVPTPRSISPQAQAFLSHVAPVAAAAAPNTREDKAAWRAYTDAANAGMVAMTTRYAERYPADVVTHKL